MLVALSLIGNLVILGLLVFGLLALMVWLKQ